MDLLNAFMGDGSGSGNGISGLDLNNIGFFSGRSLSQEETAEYIADHMFDDSALVWEKNSQGQNIMKLSEDQWSLVEGLELNMYYDDGSGYVDLGLDDIYSFDDDGNLYFSTTAKESDFEYDEIGAELKIKQYREKYKDLIEDLELYYQTFFC